MNIIDFEEELFTRRAGVWEQIQKYLPEQEPLGHYTMLREYPLRQGKYFRLGLVLLATEMFGGDPADALLAAAMQVSVDWLLIHNDTEDHSEER